MWEVIDAGRVYTGNKLAERATGPAEWTYR
jgi:hypothetical protein